MPTRVDTLLDTVPRLSMRERRDFLRRLTTLPDMAEDLQDISTFLDRKDLSTRPYSEFRSELRRGTRL